MAKVVSSSSQSYMLYKLPAWFFVYDQRQDNYKSNKQAKSWNSCATNCGSCCNECSEKFFRRLRLEAHFTEAVAQTQEGAFSVDNSPLETEGNVNSPSTSTSEENSSHDHSISTEVILQSLNPMRSKWSPLPEKFSALDHYIDKCCREIDQLNFKEKCNQYNLPQPELAALRNLRNRNDSVIRPTDKGGAFVVWEKVLYLNEAHRQLSDGRFYQRIPEDATKRNQETVEAFIAQAIAKEELPQSATNLIVQHPRTSKFYLLPKINKPGNPGRPMISACQCPIELLASYLDKVTAPFVRGLDSYVKDSGHMLTILDSFASGVNIVSSSLWTSNICIQSFRMTRDSAP